MLDKSTTIEKFLDAAAAKQPTPGGGSVAALAGALAAAMGEMVLNYSVGKKGLEEHQARLQTATAQFHQFREAMLKWMELDQAAFESLTLAKKKPADDPSRDLSIVLANKLCIGSPRSIAMKATDIIKLAEEIVDVVNPYLLSDLAVCAELAMATTRAAIYNVRVNLPSVADAEERRKIDEECKTLLTGAVRRIQQLIPRIWERATKVQ